MPLMELIGSSTRINRRFYVLNTHAVIETIAFRINCVSDSKFLIYFEYTTLDSNNCYDNDNNNQYYDDYDKHHNIGYNNNYNEDHYLNNY